MSSSSSGRSSSCSSSSSKPRRNSIYSGDSSRPIRPNPFIRLLKVLLIIKPPSPNPKFSEYIFKRGQYILSLKLLKSQIFPNSSELGSKFW